MIVKTKNCYQVIWIKCYYDAIGFSKIGIFVTPIIQTGMAGSSMTTSIQPILIHLT
jgi:hypothetical protein